MRKLVGIFLEELEDHRANLEQGILALEAHLQGNKGEAGGAPARSQGEVLEGLLRAAHSLKGAAQSVGASEISVLCHDLEQAFQDLSTGASSLTAKQIGSWLGSVDRLSGASGRLRQRYGDAPKPAAEPPLERSKATDVKPKAAVATEQGKREEGRKQPSEEDASHPASRGVTGAGPVVRVSSSKLDALLADVDELTMASTKLEHSVMAMGDLRELSKALVQTLRAAEMVSQSKAHEGVLDKVRALDAEVQRLENIARGDVHDLKHIARRVDYNVRRTRMVPFFVVCEGLDRAVRDLAQMVDKDLVLAIESEDVEVDRAVAQRLKDPLLHLLRNAATHGIESRARRAAVGKPSAGRLTISAHLRGAELEVTVRDDGRGLDVAGLRARGQKLGLEVPSEDHEVAQLVFAAGLSTADKVTSVAGRGVGLHAVRRSIEAMHGTVSVASQPGVSAQFTLRVPVLVSTLRCLFTKVSGQVFAIPCSQVIRVISLNADDLFWLDGAQVVRADGGAIPVVGLASVLGEHSKQMAERVPAIVIESEAKRIAFVVDEVLQESESLLRALPARLNGVANLSGVAQLPSGKPALVLQASDVCRAALRMLKSSTHAVNLDAPGPLQRLLVVDDSFTTRTLLKSILEEAGYEVTTARDGAEAWRLLQEQSFALVVSDVQMPNMDGLALTATIRASGRLSELPVVLVTGLSSDGERQSGLDVGATAYLTKSAFDQTALLQAIASHV